MATQAHSSTVVVSTPDGVASGESIIFVRIGGGTPVTTEAARELAKMTDVPVGLVTDVSVDAIHGDDRSVFRIIFGLGGLQRFEGGTLRSEEAGEAWDAVREDIVQRLSPLPEIELQDYGIALHVRFDSASQALTTRVLGVLEAVKRSRPELEVVVSQGEATVFARKIPVERLAEELIDSAPLRVVFVGAGSRDQKLFDALAQRGALPVMIGRRPIGSAQQAIPRLDGVFELL